jgi:hypothetical protein
VEVILHQYLHHVLWLGWNLLIALKHPPLGFSFIYGSREESQRRGLVSKKGGWWRLLWSHRVPHRAVCGQEHCVILQGPWMISLLHWKLALDAFFQLPQNITLEVSFDSLPQQNRFLTHKFCSFEKEIKSDLLCGSCKNQYSGGTYRLHHKGDKNWRASPWWWRRYVPMKCQFLQEPHNVTSQKMAFFVTDSFAIYQC